MWSKENYFLDSLAKAKLAMEIASDKQADDILLLNVRDLCSFADYFLLCTADNDRLSDAIADEIGVRVKKADGTISKYEGNSKEGWLLMDMGDVIVHIFSPEQRDKYKLEQLWDKGQKLVRIL